MYRFKEIRESKNFEKTKIAELLGVTIKAYNNWENDKETIPLRRLIQLANIYEINIDYLVGLTNVKLAKKSSNDININEVALRVREIRAEINITLRALADILGINNSTWSKYEKAITLIQTTFLIETCKMSGISVDYVLGRSKIKYLDELS